MICLISFSKFSDVFHAFTCASAIGNLSEICLGVNVLIFLLFCYLDFFNNIDYFFRIFIFRNFFFNNSVS